jgi:hypothetical protein
MTNSTTTTNTPYMCNENEVPGGGKVVESVEMFNLITIGAYGREYQSPLTGVYVGLHIIFGFPMRFM